MSGLLVQLALAGVASGAIIALIGLGVTLTYSTTRVINVAIGEFAMLAALTAASLSKIGLSLPIAAIAGVGVGTLAGGVMYKLAIEPARRRQASVLTLVIIAIAAQWVLEGVGLVVWGTDARKVPAFSVGAPLRIGGAVITRQNLWVIVVTGLLFGVVRWFMVKTEVGRALRASASNPLAARLVGISVYQMGLYASLLSAALAAVGGVFIAPQTLAVYDMGLPLALNGFIAASIGKLESPAGTVAGGFLLGFLERMAAGLLPSGWSAGVAFAVLLVVLLARAIPLMRGGILVAEKAFQE